jgi:hypothetical protein
VCVCVYVHTRACVCVFMPVSEPDLIRQSLQMYVAWNGLKHDKSNHFLLLYDKMFYIKQKIHSVPDLHCSALTVSFIPLFLLQ